MSDLPYRQPATKPSREDAATAIETLLAYLGEDPSRPGLRDTPNRVLRAWECEWGAGYVEGDIDSLVRLFEQEGDMFDAQPYDQMVVVKDIVFHSHCEHHLAPFFGVAHVAYIPDQARNRALIGISKLARVTTHFARRLQVQERLVGQIAEFLVKHLSRDVGVMLEATHTCMTSRGVMQPHSKTITTALRGAFLNDPATHQEFLRSAGR